LWPDCQSAGSFFPETGPKEPVELRFGDILDFNPVSAAFDDIIADGALSAQWAA